MAWRFAEPRSVITAHRPEAVPAALARIEKARRQGLFVAGYMAYELGYALEPRLAPCFWPQRKMPLLWFGIFERAEPYSFATPAEDLVQPCRAYAGPLRHEWDGVAHRARFDRIQRYLDAGNVYQVNLSFRSRFAFVGDAWAFYLALRRQAGAAQGAYVDDGTRSILSASPELFFDLSASGELTARPMKGTAPRGTDEASDRANRRDLAASGKDRAENLMIVDLLRNDIGRITKIGSVAVRDLFAIETYPTVHQMVSTVIGQLAPDAPAEAIIRALFPCGSVTGAPKLRAMEIIRELETSPRGVYCGSIGVFRPDGSASFNVAIRTLTITGNEGELGIGGGIVHDSLPDREYEECLLKARHYELARRPIELIETLGHTRSGGFGRERQHLARLAGSARTLGLPFDRATTRAAMKAAIKGREQRLRVRVSLAENGSIAVQAVPLAAGEKPWWLYAISPRIVSSRDLLLRHKINWRELFDEEFTHLSRLCGCDEVLFQNERGQLTEGSRTNLFMRLDGQLLTPPLAAGLLDGRLRHDLLARGECHEATLIPEDLERAEAIFLGNSLRGLIPAKPVQRD